MAFDATKPADDDFLSAFPAEMREQLRALVHDQVVDAMHIQGLSPGNLTGNLAVNNGTLNRNLNAEMLGGHAATYYSPEGHVHAVATPSSDGFMANTDKVKLDGISVGAEVNQNSFSNVAVGDKTIQADNKTDTLTFEAGANIQIIPDPTNDKITIAITGTVQNATNDGNGNNIANTYFPKTGGTINGNITANECYSNGWFRSYNDGGWWNETHHGGWNMTDDIWVRSSYDKGVYTGGKMQADGGFYGNLHGTADEATQVNATAATGQTKDLVSGFMTTDCFRIRIGDTGEDNGYAEIATADNGNEPIYVRQYGIAGNEQWGSIAHQVTLLDSNGNTSFPGTVWAPTFSGHLAGTADNATNATHAGTADNAGQLGGSTLAQVLAQISATNTGGIVAQSLGANGYVKFAGGLILQWTNVTFANYSTANISWPITFPGTCLGAVVTVNTGSHEEMNANVYGWTATGATVLSGSLTYVSVFVQSIGY